MHHRLLRVGEVLVQGWGDEVKSVHVIRKDCADICYNESWRRAMLFSAEKTIGACMCVTQASPMCETDEEEQRQRDEDESAESPLRVLLIQNQHELNEEMRKSLQMKKPPDLIKEKQSVASMKIQMRRSVSAAFYREVHLPHTSLVCVANKTTLIAMKNALS